MNTDTQTLIRTVILIVALVNQVLHSLGYTPLPIDDAQLEQILTLAFTIGASIWSWWKDNPFTYEAKHANKVMKKMKRQRRQSQATGRPEFTQENNELTGGTL